MALPSTDISFGAVNQELNGSSTSTISLDNARVRSLGQNFAASGTAFSVSSLASKSAKWAMGIAGYSLDTLEHQMAMPAIDQNALYLGQGLHSETGIEFRKFYVNGTTSSIATSYNSTQPTSGKQLYLYSMGVGPYSTSNLYAQQLATGPSGAAYKGMIMKYNSSGVFVTSGIFTNTYLLSNSFFIDNTVSGVLVDSSENNYTIWYANTTTGSPPNENWFLISTNSSLTLRWSLMFGFRTSGSGASEVSNKLYLSGVDSLGNIYIGYYASGPSSASAGQRSGYFKLNSAGTVLINQAVFFETSTSTYQESFRNIGVSKSGAAEGAVAVIGYRMNASFQIQGLFIVYYNSAGTLQWTRKIALPVISGFATGYIDGHCVIDSSGNAYYLTKFMDGANYKTYLFLIKFNSSGTVQWQKRFENTAVDWRELSFFQPALILSGNDSLITVGLITIAADIYNFFRVPGFITINTDGSNGTGTYNIVANKFTLVCNTLTPLTITSSSVISATASTNPVSSTTAVSSVQAITTQTAPSATITTINIS